MRTNGIGRTLAVMTVMAWAALGTGCPRASEQAVPDPAQAKELEAARKRLRTAIWTLRKMGLEPILLTRDDGYLIDPTVVVARR